MKLLLLGVIALVALFTGVRLITAVVQRLKLVPKETWKTLLTWIGAVAAFAVAMIFRHLQQNLLGLCALGLTVMLLRHLWLARFDEESEIWGKDGKPGTGKVPPSKMTHLEALKILGVHHTSSHAEIIGSYERLKCMVHPNIAGSRQLGRRLAEARDVALRGDEKRLLR